MWLRGASRAIKSRRRKKGGRCLDSRSHSSCPMERGAEAAGIVSPSRTQQKHRKACRWPSMGSWSWEWPVRRGAARVLRGCCTADRCSSRARPLYPASLPRAFRDAYNSLPLRPAAESTGDAPSCPTAEFSFSQQHENTQGREGRQAGRMLNGRRPHACTCTCSRVAACVSPPALGTR